MEHTAIPVHPQEFFEAKKTPDLITMLQVAIAKAIDAAGRTPQSIDLDVNIARISQVLRGRGYSNIELAAIKHRAHQVYIESKEK